ncbi:MAG: RidA family protein [Pasteurellaceae bacterium]|nr:RidA family protein [Pasteurellaceae bacterium]
MTKIIHTNKAPAAIGPYVQAVDIGDLLFTSGQIPVNPATGEIPSDIVAQTRQSLDNIKAIVEQSGLSVSDIIKTTIFVKDLAHFAAINAEYEKFFQDNDHPAFPARSCVEVARLPKDVGVEIEAIAVRK